MAPGPRKQARRLAAALFAFLALRALPSAAQSAPLELAVKATDLYKFAAFVEWPPDAFPAAADQAVLCVAGDDPFGPLLDQAVRGQKIVGRPIVVRRLDRVERGVPCNVLFLAPSRRQSIAEALNSVRGQPMLTVTDSEPDPELRGMIDFVLKDGRVRFRIDARTAAQSGLMISSRLLSLAVKP